MFGHTIFRNITEVDPVDDDLFLNMVSMHEQPESVKLKSSVTS